MRIREIIQGKGGSVVTVHPDRTVLEAMQVLVEHGIGAVVVTRGDEIAGIMSERDVLRLGAASPAALETTRVADAMTRDLIVGVPDDDLQYAMEIMTKNRIRHLPIVENDRLAGMLSIGDVVNALRSHVESENRHLRGYIQGIPS
ncbi:MAG TPA: CBS domain-containing protein [Longimicrobiales bacterium]|nr:CBS domain-containing protein [Longimicrobiales bacterium]